MGATLIAPIRENVLCENLITMNRMTFQEIAGLWKTDKAVYVKKSTFLTYSLLISTHLIPEFGTCYDISEETVQKFVEKKIAEGLSLKYVKDIIVVLKMILRYAGRKNLWTFIEMDVHFPVQLRQDKPLIADKESQKCMLEYIRDNFSFLNFGIYLSASTGMRIGELCALKWQDMDLDEGVVRVTKTLQRVYIPGVEKGRTELLVDTPKSASSIREIPLCADVLRMLQTHCRDLDGENYILTDSPSPVEPRSLRNYYKKLQERLGLPVLKFHSLRHSFATRCIECQCDYKTVSSLLGHSKISTTLNLYVHPDLEQKRRCVDKMAQSMI